ncbi:MAG: ComEA family DNA-binding protein [Chloroflexi bacterium]|nr:ComEA family DNA-binding protein [Chloroflexota bacterium]
MIEHHRTSILVALLLLLASGGVLALSRALAVPPPLAILTPTPGSRSIAVAVTGRVAAPGVYTLVAGARVADAIEAAGGALPDADPAAVVPGLAVRLRDEMHIRVPARDEPPPIRVSATPGAGRATTTPQSAQPVNLNTADAAQLEALPGVGRVTAQKIIDSRQSQGPFGSVAELRDRKLVGQAVFERIKELVTVP